MRVGEIEQRVECECGFPPKNREFPDLELGDKYQKDPEKKFLDRPPG